MVLKAYGSHPTGLITHGKECTRSVALVKAPGLALIGSA